jgi:hypothetical protein
MGPAKPDQEWCSGVFGMQLTKGESDGVDLSGVKAVLHFELPGDFLGGIDKARLYIDPSVSDDQRREIDAIFHGEKGGLWGGMKEAIKEWLPTKVAAIEFSNGGSPGAKVEGIGNITLQPVTTEDGKPATISNAPILAAFNMASEKLAFATGTRFADPDMRSWESLGQGGTTTVEWSA